MCDKKVGVSLCQSLKQQTDASCTNLPPRQEVFAALLLQHTVIRTSNSVNHDQPGYFGENPLSTEVSMEYMTAGYIKSQNHGTGAIQSKSKNHQKAIWFSIFRWCFSITVKLLMSDKSCAMKVYKEAFREMNSVFGNLPKWLSIPYMLFSDAPPTGSNMKRTIYIHHDLIMRPSNHSSSSSPFPARRTSCVSSGLCSKKQLWSTNWAGSCTSTRPCCWYGPLKKGTKHTSSLRRQKEAEEDTYTRQLLWTFDVSKLYSS